jgi:zinc D-Ala-D-Ala carboxypeptidase
MNLSKNFTLEEATRSHKADSLHINNSIPAQLLPDAVYFAQRILQPVRDKIGIPFDVTSWYRCPALNKAVGGVSTSAHLSAMALDFTVTGHTARESFDLVLVALKDLRINFDQLIVEKNTKTGASWVHLGLKKTGNRNQSFALTV